MLLPIEQLKGKVIITAKGTLKVVDVVRTGPHGGKLLVQFPDGSLNWHARMNVENIANGWGGFKNPA